MENKTYYLTYVVGERGVGKTTLLAHFACRYMIPPLSVYDLSICKKEIERACRYSPYARMRFAVLCGTRQFHVW